MRVGLELSYDGRPMLWRPVEPGLLVVGSNPECDLCIPAGPAPVQCLIRRDRAAVILENRHPEGTLVGQEVVEGTIQLANEDRVGLGPVEAVVRFIEEEEAGAGRTRTLVGETSPQIGSLRLTVPELHPGKHWSVDSGLTLGSDPTNDVVIDDPFVSSFHARVSIEAGRCIIRDLDSRNGLFVAGQKITEGEIAPGNQIRLGETVVLLAGAAEPGGPPESSRPVRLLGRSAVMQRVRELVRRLAAADAPVLITGETGTGKEVVARLVMELSARAGRPFVALNCGSVSRNLVESELFGHEKGAFTGAEARKQGAFEAADKGTLFLDEVGELPLDLQPQLLRVLETGEIRRVGSAEPFAVDVRVVAATNRLLEQEVAAGRFREDLFHRLYVLTVDLPPLRERKEDIGELADHFLQQFAPAGTSVSLSQEARAVLGGHDWPGNVRELRNVVQRAVLMRRGDCLQADEITFTPSTLVSRVETVSATSSRTLLEIERDAIIAELRRFGGNKKEAAAALGISRSTIHRKIDEYGIHGSR